MESLRNLGGSIVPNGNRKPESQMLGIGAAKLTHHSHAKSNGRAESPPTQLASEVLEELDHATTWIKDGFRPFTFNLA